MIVKVQLAIVTNVSPPPVLIYNESRLVFYAGPAEGVTNADALSDEPTQFWNAHVHIGEDGQGRLILTSPADWQDW